MPCVWYKWPIVGVYEVHGRWKGESAGGCVNYPTWRNNPQYLLHVKQTRVLTITLAQIDTTALLPIGLYLGQSSGTRP
jgi:hypothetical protein